MSRNDLVVAHRSAHGWLGAWTTLPRLSLLLLSLSTFSWRQGTYFSGGIDPVVMAKAGLSVIALLMAFVVRGQCRSPISIGTRSVWFLISYCAITFFGAWSYGSLLATVVLIVRILIVATTVMLLVRAVPFERLLSDLLASMGLIVGIAAVTGVGSLASRGRLSGGIPPLDPNTIAMVCALVIIWVVWKALAGTASGRQLALAALLAVVLWTTGSRTGMAALVIGLMLMVFVCGSLRPPVFVGLALVSIGVVYLVVGTDLVANYFERGGSANLDTLSSRTVAWSAAFEFAHDPWTTWFGAGLAVKQIPVQGQYWATQILDSSWMSALVQSGYLGVALLFAWVLSIAVASFRAPAVMRTLLVGLAAYLVSRSVLESGLFDSSPTFLAFWMVSLCSDRTSRASLLPSMTARSEGNALPSSVEADGPAISSG